MQPLENPFLAARAEVERLRLQTKIISWTSRRGDLGKIALAWMLDGQVSAVVGTHTHVQTADEQIFPGGTAYLTDAGFTGPHESVLGREIEPRPQTLFSPACRSGLKWRKNNVLLHAQ